MKNLSSRSKSTLNLLLLLAAMLCFYGANDLIQNGGGKKLGLSHDFLDMTMIDYLFPGVIVFSTIGLFSVIAFTINLFSKHQKHWLFICDGMLLIAWTMVQLLLLGFRLVPLQLILLTIGAILLFGPLAKKKQVRV